MAASFQSLEIIQTFEFLYNCIIPYIFRKVTQRNIHNLISVPTKPTAITSME